MNEISIQDQISELNRKIDFLITEVTLQKEKRQELEDLVSDLQLIGKDMFNSTVEELDKAGIEVKGECVTRLGLNIAGNISNFNYLLSTLQSAIDFFEDFTPILRQIGLDTLHKFAEFEQKGYFEYVGQLAKIMETVAKNYTVEDLKKLNENIPMVINIIRSVSTTENLQALQQATEVISRLKMDNTLDDKSFFKLYKEFKSPEVRKSMSYALRILKEIIQNQK
ncbi:MAG: hypothetical protein WCH34_16140 [Bacteroidota bacterium]